MHSRWRPGGRRRPVAGIRWGWVPVLLLMAACGGSFAYLQPSRQVTETFERLELPDTYRYYTTGSPYRPEALVGVLPDFAPPAGGPWDPAPKGTDLRQMIRGMQFFDEQGLQDGMYGAALQLPGGRRAGIWYSARGRGTVHLDADGRLFVWPPRKRWRRMILLRD